MTSHLFVYGSLVPGGLHHDLMEPVGGQWRKAQLRGYYSPDGWGHCGDYPAIIVDTAGDAIPGWVVSSTDLMQHIPRLDEFEGEMYERIYADTVCEDGELVSAFVYVLAGSERRGRLSKSLLA